MVKDFRRPIKDCPGGVIYECGARNAEYRTFFDVVCEGICCRPVIEDCRRQVPEILGMVKDCLCVFPEDLRVSIYECGVRNAECGMVSDALQAGSYCRGVVKDVSRMVKDFRGLVPDELRLIIYAGRVVSDEMRAFVAAGARTVPVRSGFDSRMSWNFVALSLLEYAATGDQSRSAF